MIAPTGDDSSLEGVGETLIPIARGQMVPLRDIADVKRVAMTSPPERAYANGEAAVVLAVCMMDGTRVLEFGPCVLSRTDELSDGLPVGAELTTVTNQAEQVGRAVFGVTINVGQTLLLVCGIVILLLGLRAGLIVGALMPAGMLATIALFGLFGVSLERMSLATLIIALGIFVDNGMVVTEDFKRRLGAGVSRKDAAEGVGQDLAFPLLASTLVTLLALLPLMLAPSDAGEYTRSIPIVVAISLSISWMMAMTFTPILYSGVLETPAPDAPVHSRKGLRSNQKRLPSAFDARACQPRHRPCGDRSIARARNCRHCDGAEKVLAGLGPGADPRRHRLARRGHRRSDQRGYSGPCWHNRKRRVRLAGQSRGSCGLWWPALLPSLTPVDPAPNRAFMVLNVTAADTIDRAIDELRTLVEGRFPEIQSSIGRMFLGPADRDVIDVELSGPDADYL